jgi:hypothetical protein
MNRFVTPKSKIFQTRKIYAKFAKMDSKISYFVLKFYFQQHAQSKLSKDKKPKPVSNATPKPVLTFPLLESSLDQSTQKPRKASLGSLVKTEKDNCL